LYIKYGVNYDDDVVMMMFVMLVMMMMMMMIMIIMMKTRCAVYIHCSFVLHLQAGNTKAWKG
jgi:hypothetical protein